MDIIALWEQEIEENENKEKQLREEAIYNFYGNEPVNEGVISKLKSLFKKATNTKKENKPSTKSNKKNRKLTDEEKSAREKLYNEIMDKAKEVFSKFSDKDPKFSKGFSLGYDDSNDDKSDFVEGRYDYFTVFAYDAWGYTDNKARDDNQYGAFLKVLESFIDDTAKELREYGSLDYSGDWDDGDYIINISNSTIKKYEE